MGYRDLGQYFSTRHNMMERERICGHVHLTRRELLDEIKRRSDHHHRYLNALSVNSRKRYPLAKLTRETVQRCVRHNINPCHGVVNDTTSFLVLHTIVDTMKHQAASMGLGQTILKVFVTFDHDFYVSSKNHSISISKTCFHPGIRILELCHILLWYLFQLRDNDCPVTHPVDIGAGSNRLEDFFL